MLSLLIKKIARYKKREGIIGGCLRSWWVILFSLGALSFYQHSIQKKECILASLNDKKSQLQKAKELALMTQRELQLEICSQCDPAYLELALMRELGVVPEGQIKVHFEN